MTGLQWLKRKQKKEPEKVISEEKQVEVKPAFEPLLYSMDGETFYMNAKKYSELREEDDEKAFKIFDEFMSNNHPLVMVFD